MKISQPIVSEIAYNTYCINEFGMDAMFLLVGDKRALLIDTGTGVFDLKALVESLTDKPITVALTHGHVDHAGNIGLFEEVYMHEADFEMAITLSREERQGYLKTMMAMSNDLFDLSEDDVIKHEKLPKLISISEGDLLDLGNREVAVYETPGHTKGSIAFLDYKEKILFSGDACNSNTLVMGGSLEDVLETAKKLQSIEAYYNRNYNGHIGYASYLDCKPQGYSVNQDAIELVTKLIDGSETGVLEPSPFMKNGYHATLNNFGIRWNKE